MATKKDNTKGNKSILGAISSMARRKRETTQEARAKTFAELLEEAHGKLEGILTEEEIKAKILDSRDKLFKGSARLAQLKLIQSLLGLTIEECAVFAEQYAEE